MTTRKKVLIGIGALGTGLLCATGIGLAVAPGPAAALVASILGATASTGTPIAALNGIAAYNAALAIAGGGTLAMGGGGIAAGTTFVITTGVVTASGGVSIGTVTAINSI